jgi:hypothetical protein
VTDEQIKAIRDARESSDALRRKQDEERRLWEKENLSPLLKVCDHQYPWGESAYKTDYTSNDKQCHICGST